MIQYIREFINRLNEHRVTALAAQLSYYMILSFFPFMIFILTLVGFSSLDAGEVLLSLEKLLPYEAFVLIRDTIVQVVDNKSGNLMSFGIILTLYSGSRGIRALNHGLNTAYNCDERRSFIKGTIISILFLIVLAVAIVGAFLLIVFGQMIGTAIIEFLKLDNAFAINWNIYRYVFSVVLMFFIFSGIYAYLPTKRLHWWDVIYGSLFCTLGWIIASLGFAFYVNNFSNYSSLYGGLGAVIVLMTWIYMSSIIILVGGEINAFLSED